MRKAIFTARSKSSFSKGISHFLVLLGILFWAAALTPCFAQSTGVLEQGLKPYGSYHAGDFDAIGMVNNPLTLHIPLVSYPQSGGKLRVGFSLIYRNPFYALTNRCGDIDPRSCPPKYIWTMGYGNSSQPIQIVPDFFPQMGGDGKFEISLLTVDEPDGASHPTGRLVGGKSMSEDGTGFVYDWTVHQLVDRFGTVYQLKVNDSNFPTSLASIQDTNGNVITTNFDPIGVPVSWTDTIGRNIPAPSNSVATDSTGCTGALATNMALLWAPPGPNGGQNQFKICYSTFPLSYDPGLGFTGEPIAQSLRAIQSIVLYDGTSWTSSPAWTFAIDNKGALAKITLPTGGSISYTWAPVGYCLHNSPPRTLSVFSLGATSRTVDDGTGSHVWQYAQSQTSDGLQTIVTDPDLNDTVHAESSLIPAGCSLYETELDQYAGRYTEGNVLRKTTTTYYHSPNPYQPGPLINVVPLTIATTNVASGLVSQVTKTYDTGTLAAFGGSILYGNVMTQQDYDWGSAPHGPLLRTTSTLYSAENSAYAAKNILTLPVQEAVFASDAADGACGANGAVACTSYGYDEDNGSPQGVFGNQTSITRWLNTGTSPTSQAVYNSQGMITNKIDPKGNKTVVTYDATGLFLSQIQSPDTLGVHHIESFVHDTNTGAITSHIDQNGNKTSFTYDSLGRALTVAYPDGGATSFDYHNDALPLRVTQTESATPDPSIVTSTVYDGLGREASTTVDSDPACSGGSRTDFTYDGIGRTHTVSNPYCTTSDPTYGLTTYIYDPLGRATQVVQPDGSVIKTSYSGSCTKTTDEAGKPRTSCADSQGRLVEVDEPGGPGSPATPGSGSGVVAGSEQSTQLLVQAALYASGSVQLSGNPQWRAVTDASTGGTSSVTVSGSEQQYPAGVNPGVGTITISGTEQPPAQVAAAIPGTGSVSINGALQSKQVQTQVVSPGSGSFTISGSERMVTVQVRCGNPHDTNFCPLPFWDAGTVTISVNGFTASANYANGATTASIAGSLLGQLNSPGSPVTASLNGNTISMTSYASGSAANYSLSSSAATTDPIHFSGTSFQAIPSGTSLTGGLDAAYVTVYDSGTAAITVNGHTSPPPGSQPVVWGQGSTSASVAIALASAINGDTSAFANATASGNVVMLTARNAGAGSNYPLSSSLTFDSGNFSGPSFTSGNSGPVLNGGQDAVYVYDSGSVSVTVNNHTTPPAGSPPVVWGQGSTAASIASALTAAITADTGASVRATSSGNLVTLTAKAKGSVSNYSLAASYTHDTAHFSQSSFTPDPSGTTLVGGWPDAQAVDKGAMTITINGHNYTSSWGQTATPGNIASDLASKISDPAVGVSLVGNIVYLDPKQPGVVYSLSTANTHDTANFSQSSFNQANAISDYGLATVTVNGVRDSVSWAGRSTPSSIAADLASKIRTDPAAVVGANAVGDTVSLTSTQPGIVSNYSLSATSSFDSVNFPSGSLVATASGAKLIGGLDAIYKTVFDTGVVSLAVNGYKASVPYQQGSTAASIVSALANQFNAPHSPITALASDSTLGLTSREPGVDTNYPLSPSFSSDQPGLFPQPSFSLAVSGPALVGGTDQTFDVSSPSITRYAYDPLGNLTCVIQKGQDATPFTNCSSAPKMWRPRSFVYDSLSRLTSSHNPESGTLQYTYDANGNVTSKTDARGFTINFSPPDSPIDALNRVTKKTYSTNDLPVSYFYDQTGYKGLTIVNGIGRRTGMSDASGASAWSYDSMGRASVEQQTINGITKSTAYTYDLAGNVRNLTYPDGEVVVFGFNGAGRPLSAVDNNLGIKFADQATYLPGGQLTGAVFGSSVASAGVTTSNSYNQRLQPIFISAASPTQTVFSLGYDFHVGHGDNGNVYQITNNRDDDRTQHFSYDGLNRIQSAWTSGPKWGETFTIDTWGNLTNRSRVAGKTYYESLAVSKDATVENRLVALTDDAGLSLDYDANGNMTKDGSGKYVYDAENRISSTAGVTFTYNGDDTRVMKSDGVIDWGPGPLSRSDLDGNITRNFVFFGGKRIARRVLPANTIDYMFSDHLGSLGVMTDADGKIEGESDYYPFGGEQVISGGLTAYKFTGKERDAESGLDDFGARYHSSSMGRFMSPDSSGYSGLTNPQSWNLYSYTLNNPLRFVDPTGHTVQNVCSDVVACTAAVAGATGNAEAASRVSSTTTTTDHSFLGFHWTTSVTNIAISGDMASFRALSANASHLADLVESKENFTVDIRDSYFTGDRQGWQGSHSNTVNSEAIVSGGFTQGPRLTGNRDGNVYVEWNPSRHDAEALDEGIPGSNISETMAHELLGHLWGEVFGGHPSGAANKQEAVNAENIVRATDPSRGQKSSHDHDQIQLH